MFSRLCRTFSPPLIVVAALLLFRLAVGSTESTPDALPLAGTPVLIAPTYDVPQVATDEQLAAVLARVTPPAGPANTNKLVHALRLWGNEATFADPALPSGPVMHAYFLRDDVYRQLAGETAPPLFAAGSTGIIARPWERTDPTRDLSSHHTNDLLATLAETRTPLATPLVMREGTATVSDALQSALDNYRLDQLEDEWTIIALARYGFPLTEWTNAYGEKLDLDSIARELIAAPLDHGPCNGTHRLEALVMMLRANEQTNVLSPKTVAAIEAHLTQLSALLTAAQRSDGSWSRAWPTGAAGAEGDPGSLYDRILVTGHQLEWLALAPESVQPPRETIVRAGQWLVHSMTEVDESNLAKNYGPFSHAARALCLWRGAEAFPTWQRVQSHIKE